MSSPISKKELFRLLREDAAQQTPALFARIGAALPPAETRPEVSAPVSPARARRPRRFSGAVLAPAFTGAAALLIVGAFVLLFARGSTGSRAPAPDAAVKSAGSAGAAASSAASSEAYSAAAPAGGGSAAAETDGAAGAVFATVPGVVWQGRLYAPAPASAAAPARGARLGEAGGFTCYAAAGKPASQELLVEDGGEARAYVFLCPAAFSYGGGSYGFSASPRAGGPQAAAAGRLPGSAGGYPVYAVAGKPSSREVAVLLPGGILAAAYRR